MLFTVHPFILNRRADAVISEKRELHFKGTGGDILIEVVVRTWESDEYATTSIEKSG
jgi:hypothetical protein